MGSLLCIGTRYGTLIHSMLNLPALESDLLPPCEWKSGEASAQHPPACQTLQQLSHPLETWGTCITGSAYPFWHFAPPSAAFRFPPVSRRSSESVNRSSQALASMSA